MSLGERFKTAEMYADRDEKNGENKRNASPLLFLLEKTGVYMRDY